jgi:hypothetical protein
LTIQAKSKRSRNRLTYIAKHAVPPVKEALALGKLSISTAEAIAHNPPELQEAVLAKTPPPRRLPTDEKTILFPGTEERLALEELKADWLATAKLEAINRVKFTRFQREFASAWRKLIRVHRKEHSYGDLFELANQVAARMGGEFGDKPSHLEV